MVGGDAAQPFSNVTRVEFALSCRVFMLLFEGGRLVKDDLTLACTTVHADLSLGSGGHLFDFLDDLRELCRTYAVLGNDVTDTISVVVLF